MVENTPIQVFLSSDEGYAPHLGTAVASIVKNAAPLDRLSFRILDCGLSRETREALSRIAGRRGFSVRFIEPLPEMPSFAERVATPMPDNVLPDMTYYRLMIGTLFPELDRILYLDCDLVVRKSLKGLWETSLEGRMLGAIEDQGRDEKLANEKRLLGADPYFNSGVLLVDLEAWRAREAQQRILDYARDSRHIPRYWHDQSLLNAVLRDEALFLDRTWNSMVSTPEGIPDDPAIVHYTYSKPWKYAYRHVPYAADYWTFRKMTPWGSRDALAGYKQRFLAARAREAWRHPKQVLKAILGMERWTTALPKGLEG
jgi:lipopolysaccharide biosynthesis glycosyltransferase